MAPPLIDRVVRWVPSVHYGGTVNSGKYGVVRDYWRPGDLSLVTGTLFWT